MSENQPEHQPDEDAYIEPDEGQDHDPTEKPETDKHPD
jgi:hypothetical protein